MTLTGSRIQAVQWIFVPAITIFALFLGYLQVWGESWGISVVAGICIFLGLILISSFFVVWMLCSQVGENSSSILLIKTEKELYDRLYRRSDSVVRSATGLIIATGSRSRDTEYLDSILNKLRASDLRHWRILFPHHAAITNEMKKHLDGLLTLKDATKPTSGAPRVKVVSVSADSRVGERFICASESQVLYVLQSPNQLDGYDTALLVRSKKFAHELQCQLKNFATMGGSVEIRSRAEAAESGLI